MIVKGKRVEDITVLIVEDQDDVRAMIKSMTMDIGLTQAFEATDGREALSFLDALDDYVDLIICDWNMPGMNGVELLRQVRSVYKDMPFLIVTGRDDMDSVLEAKSSGATAYIRKPFTLPQLEAKIRVAARKINK